MRNIKYMDLSTKKQSFTRHVKNKVIAKGAQTLKMEEIDEEEDRGIFTAWFDAFAKDNFENMVKPLLQGRTINYLEIGCYEGASVMYMFENVISDDSLVTVVDPFENSRTKHTTVEKFLSGLQKYEDRITVVEGFSQNELRKLEKESFDLIYVDGEPTSHAVFNDGRHAFA